MRLGGIEVKRRVWISLLFALTSVVFWWLWNGSKIPVAAAKPSARQPAVRLAAAERGPGDNVLRERAEYLDPTPLFFPTEWNFGQGALKEGVKPEPGQIFGFVDPQFVFGDQDIKPYNAEPIAPNGRLADVVQSGNEAPFAGIGTKEIQPVILPERGGFLEITNLRDGKTILSQTLTDIPGIGSDFVPLEFLVTVGASGLISDPVLMTGSGREEMELFLLTYLAKSFRVGDRLAPGMYRILIGP
jgi:hypothetical protein